LKEIVDFCCQVKDKFFVVVTVLVVDVIVGVVVVVVAVVVITFMQGIYNYIPETNCVSRICSFAAVLYLQFTLHVMLPVPAAMWSKA
jgi:hypothetical protein